MSNAGAGVQYQDPDLGISGSHLVVDVVDGCTKYEVVYCARESFLVRRGLEAFVISLILLKVFLYQGSPRAS